MVNQSSDIGLGNDATLQAAYGFMAGDRLGNFDLILENTGGNDAYVVIKEFTGLGSPNSVSGYVPVTTPVVLVPRGTRTLSLILNSIKFGIFGSGNTAVNVSTVIRNPGNLRGAQIDITSTGRRGWGYDAAYDIGAQRSPGWGAPPDAPDAPRG